MNKKRRENTYKPPEIKVLKNIPRASRQSDVLGSYTGMDVNGERPEQDADDL